MNYIHLINRFWDAHEEFDFNPYEYAVFFYLLKVNNLTKWKPIFKHNNAKVCANTGIKDLRTIEKARIRLKESGLIDYKKDGNNPNVTYSLAGELPAINDVNSTEQDHEAIHTSLHGTLHEPLHEMQSTMQDFMHTKDKQNKTKPKLNSFKEKKEEKKESSHTPPTQPEVVEYFFKKGWKGSDHAESFMKHMRDKGFLWRDWEMHADNYMEKTKTIAVEVDKDSVKAVAMEICEILSISLKFDNPGNYGDYQKFNKVYTFSENMARKSMLDVVSQKVQEYKKYKELSGEMMHRNVENFIGDYHKGYENGAWNSDWENEIEKLKRKKNVNKFIENKELSDPASEFERVHRMFAESSSE